MLAKSPPFLMWYDDNPKLPVVRKIEDAIEAYCERFRGTRPTLVLVNEEEVTEITGVEVRGVTTVRRNTYWVGQEDQPPVALVPEEAQNSVVAPRPEHTRRPRTRRTAPVRSTS